MGALDGQGNPIPFLRPLWPRAVTDERSPALSWSQLAPLGDRREVREHVSGHHVQTCLCELQVKVFQVVIGLGHRALVCRPQAGARERGLDPARIGATARSGASRGRAVYHRGQSSRHAGAEGSRSERPSRARGPLNHSLPKNGYTAPGGRQTGAYGQIQAGSSEQRPRRPGERLAPHQSRGELGDPFVAEQWSHAETRRPQNTDEDCILPPGLPWRTGRVWVPGEALHSPPHSAGQPHPAIRRRGLCRSHSNTNLTPPWLFCS